MYLLEEGKESEKIDLNKTEAKTVVYEPMGTLCDTENKAKQNFAKKKARKGV